MIYIMLYKKESKGLKGPIKVSTRWPMRCYITYYIHAAELKETA